MWRKLNFGKNEWTGRRWGGERQEKTGMKINDMGSKRNHLSAKPDKPSLKAFLGLTGVCFGWGKPALLEHPHEHTHFHLHLDISTPCQFGKEAATL